MATANPTPPAATGSAADRFRRGRVAEPWRPPDRWVLAFVLGQLACLIVLALLVDGVGRMLLYTASAFVVYGTIRRILFGED